MQTTIISPVGPGTLSLSNIHYALVVEKCKALATCVFVNRQREQVRGIQPNLVTIHRGLALSLEEQRGGVLVIERNQNCGGNIQSLGGNFFQVFGPVDSESPLSLPGEARNNKELIIICPDNPGAFLWYNLPSLHYWGRALAGSEDPGIFSYELWESIGRGFFLKRKTASLCRICIYL